MRKIYLHIGAGKTGTSAIQSQLVLNRVVLEKHNYYYPEAGSDASAKIFKITSGNAVELGFLLKDKSNIDRKIKNSIKKYIKDAKGKNIILSSEVMEVYIETNALKLKKEANKLGYEVVVVYYVRAIADHLVSSYHQLVKRHHFTGHFTKVIQKKTNRFLSRIQTSVEIFGKECVYVKNYDKVKENIFLDFIQKILHITECNEFNIINKKVNRSLTDDELSLMQHMNTFFTKPEESTFVSNALIHQNPTLKYVMSITQDDLDKVMLMYENDIEQINAYLEEDEKPLTVMHNLKVTQSRQNKQLNPFQRSVLSILSEITKELKK